MKKCINCNTLEFVEEFINPFEPSETIFLCYVCSHRPFRDFTNKKFMKKWFERDKKTIDYKE